MRQTTNLRKVQVRKPMNEPTADLRACWCSLPAIFSPRYAPRKGPAIRPSRPKGPMVIHKIGKTITAIINPIVLPRAPPLDHQNLFVHRMGMKYSNTAIIAMINAQIIKKLREKGWLLVKCNRSSPINPTNGPGNTGKIDPMMARRIQRKEMMMRKISILRIILNVEFSFTG